MSYPDRRARPSPRRPARAPRGPARARTVLIALTLVLTACARPPAPEQPRLFGPAVDSPWELEDEADWVEVRDEMLALPPGEPRRRDLRVQLAAAQASRIARWLDANRPALAHEALLELARLWSDDPAALGAELAPHAPVLARARRVFARAGADREAALALVLLGEVEPARRDAHWAELDEVLAYADDLAIAQHGPQAVRSQPIELLEPIALALPLPAVTDRFVTLVVDRQRAVSEALSSDGASFALVRAHTEVLRAARHVAAALARAGRADEIARHVAAMIGIGGDDDLSALAVAVASPQATARDWVKLARAFRAREGDGDDDAASARAVALAGLRRFPGDATLLAAAAVATADLQRLREAIRLHEELRRAVPRDPEVADRLAGLYRDRLAALALNDRPVDAAARLAELERYHAEIARAFPGRAWSTTLAGAYATVGRGLVAQGELDAAIDALERSVELAPDAEAYEMLATVAVKRARWAEARRWAERGAAIGGAGPGRDYTRAKLLKLAGDAAAGGGDVRAARARWMEALSTWADLGEGVELPPALQGERLVQGGQLLWALGERAEGLRLLEASVDLDPDGADTHTQVVAFFIAHDEYARALDAYHRALLADRIGDYHKTYMSLWVVAEARRRGDEPDPLAVDYLAVRDGALWHDELARLATGRIELAALARRAGSRARKAELAYYTAALGLGDGGQARPPAEIRALLEDVVATEMVLFFEYEMARAWLAGGQ